MKRYLIHWKGSTIRYATSTVHASSRKEAIKKAEQGEDEDFEDLHNISTKVSWKIDYDRGGIEIQED